MIRRNADQIGFGRPDMAMEHGLVCREFLRRIQRGPSGFAPSAGASFTSHPTPPPYKNKLRRS